MNVLGLDLSLTAPGVAYNEFPFALPSTQLKGMACIELRAQQILEVLNKQQQFDVAVIEGQYAQSGRGAESVAHLGGVVRLILHGRGIPYAVVPPSTLKLYATGNGRADKDEMIREAIKCGVTLPKKRQPKFLADAQFNDDACDAWWLMQTAFTHYTPNDPRLSVRPASHRKTLSKVEWPRIKQKEETS